jgi:hypothetical protein
VAALLAESIRLSDEGQYLEAQQFVRSALEQARAFGPQTMRFRLCDEPTWRGGPCARTVSVDRSYYATRRKLTLHFSRGLANTFGAVADPAHHAAAGGEDGRAIACSFIVFLPRQIGGAEAAG